VKARVRNANVRLWSYLPLTRTLFKPLTAALLHRGSHQPCACPEPERERPWSLRERLNERDIANLITAYAKAPPPLPTV
jgi:hypothetical protein